LIVKIKKVDGRWKIEEGGLKKVKEYWSF